MNEIAKGIITHPTTMVNERKSLTVGLMKLLVLGFDCSVSLEMLMGNM